MASTHNILMLAFPNAQLLDVAGPLQMFAGANDELSRQVYRIEIAAPEAGLFATSSGVRLVADLSFAQVTNRRLARTHTLIVVGGETVSATSSRAALSRRSSRARSAECLASHLFAAVHSSWRQQGRWTVGAQRPIGAPWTH